MNPVKMTVEAIRVQMGMTQEEFAEKLGISTSTYIQKVKKRAEWKGSELNKIKHLSGVSLDCIDF